MNVVIISALHPPAALYLVRKIQERWTPKRVIRPIGFDNSLSLFKRLKGVSITKIMNLPGNLIQSMLTNRRNKEMTQLLFHNSNSAYILNCDEILWSKINSEESVNHIRSLEPDILLVCMAPILKPEVFTIPRIATVNVHFGIAPHYRGEHTIFWPLYFGDYENIGVTLHQINKGIDSGGILAQGYPAIEKRDNESTLWAKSSQIAVNMVLDLLAAAQKGKIQGRKQDFKGRLFLRKDRNIWKDLHYYYNRNILRKYPKSHPQRIVKYF